MPVKVLEIISQGYVAGGAETILLKRSSYLLNKSYSVKILASDLGDGKQHFNDYTFKSINNNSPLKLLFTLFNPYSFDKARKVLDDYKPDIVHLHTMHQITASVLFLLKKYPTVITLHGPEAFLTQLIVWCLTPPELNFKREFYNKDDLNRAGKLKYFYFKYIQKFIYKLAFKNVDVFIAPSKYMQNMAGTDVSPVIHLPNFIELQEFHELTHNYNLLFVGRLEKVKGVEYLIKAIPSIIKVFPQTRLTIIGDGSDKTDLVNLTKTLQIEEYIQFIGWVEHANIHTYYKNTSIVVMPSIWPENFPTVCNEAMSVGRPVIGTNVGGIAEIIDHEINGYVVEPKNPEQIAEKVIKLFSEESLLKDFSRKARKKAEEFSMQKHVFHLEKIYEELMAKYKTKEASKSILQAYTAERGV